MDKIVISNLELFAHHGVFSEENVLGQKFIVSAVLYTDLSKACESDQITESINYVDVCKIISGISEKENFNLLEAFANKICNTLLLAYDEIKMVNVEIKKPWAPILMPLDTVSVNITRKWHEVYLGVGSNIGDKKAYLDMAVNELNNDLLSSVEKISDFIITKPVGGVEQDDFLNGCVKIKTIREPYNLLAFINTIEEKAKRERKIHWGPRTLDIDILFYDNIVMSEERLIIPHPEVCNREFVLKPLNQIAPFYIHPVYRIMVREMLDKINS